MFDTQPCIFRLSDWADYQANGLAACQSIGFATNEVENFLVSFQGWAADTFNQLDQTYNAEYDSHVNGFGYIRMIWSTCFLIYFLFQLSESGERLRTASCFRLQHDSRTDCGHPGSDRPILRGLNFATHFLPILIEAFNSHHLKERIKERV